MDAFVFLDAPASAATALASLPPWLAAWFTRRYGEPTEAQRLAWPAISAGGNVLVSAPTGTGKTLAALLPVLGSMEGGQGLRAVVVSPLKALVADTVRTLEADLADLAEEREHGLRIAARTGDASPAERKALHEAPPDVLVTTPESLGVLLTRADASRLFAGLRWLVVDEVHALAGNKRGADLSLSLERVSALSGEARRVGLSATATPLREAARWLAGTDRACSIVRVGGASPPELVLEPLPEGEKFLAALTRRLALELPRHRSTLVFTNTRGLAERLAWNLRRAVPEMDARIAVHHSALAARRRREVEQRFKRGELAAVVSSTSLELGIDIGSVGLAVLVHPPGDVVRLLQRVGRAGHEPGGVRRGLVLTGSASELLEATVTAASGRSGQCEPFAVPPAPLDVLCQHLLGACCSGPQDADALHGMFKRAAPFASLTREDFDDCLRYLRGLDREGRAWLPARLREDGDQWTVQDDRTARLLRRNLGTILTDRAVAVVLRAPDPTEDDPVPQGTQVGEIDEAFAERLAPGERFLLDGRCLEFRSLGEGGAVVEEVPGRPRVPRWGGDGWPLSPELARRLFVLRTQAAEALREGAEALRRLLAHDYALTPEGVDLLAAYFQQQEAVSEVPGAATLLIEAVDMGVDTELYLHTPLNRTANDSLARVAVERLRREGRSATTQVADLGWLLKLRGAVADPAGLLRRLLEAEGFLPVLEAALAESEAVRLRFGRVAQTGLMVLRNPEGRPRKVGGSAWSSRELFDRLRRREPGFVLLRQALGEARAELCDAAAGEEYARSLPLLTVRCRWLPVPSPFARAWTQQDAGPGGDPLSAEESLLRLHAELMGAADAVG
ncbi:MAG: DEAD/DEAH box helicase [Gemmataceae bacterium]|nr:DEAD/DEAH box helicase [Gemmataceae bacterium]